MKRLKILVSAYACNPIDRLRLYPGEDHTGWKLVEQLSSFNEVSVITHTYNEQGIVSHGRSSTIKFHYVRLPWPLSVLNKFQAGQRVYYYLWQVAAWRVARRLHEKFHFDATHHVTFGNDWMPSFIGAFLPAPFIWGPIGGGQKTPETLFKKYTMAGQLAELVRSCAQGIGRKLLPSRRRCMNRAKAVLVCNTETKSRIPKKFSAKTYFFPVNGISRDDLPPELFREYQHEGFKIISAGRLHRLKGFGIAIEAFSKFRGKCSHATLEIIGQGAEEMNLRKLVKKSNLNGSVHFMGWRSRADVLKEMHGSDVFLFPSLRDGGGGVVVEAMASGLPVICLDVGGPGFHIQDGWGIKIKPKSPEYVVNEIAKALERLYLDRDLRERLGRAARKRAEEFYLWDRLGERLMMIYEETLRDDRASAQ